jgi:hypothetical protein
MSGRTAGFALALAVALVVVTVPVEQAERAPVVCEPTMPEDLGR